MPAGQIKAGLGYLVSNAGEYLVVGELLRRGFLAALTPRNAKAYDVIAEQEGAVLFIRVKTKSAAADDWVWNVKKTGEIFRDIQERDYSVLVDLKPKEQHPDYFVVPTRDLDEVLRANFEAWLRAPSRGLKEHDPDSKQRRLGGTTEDTNWLGQYRDAWGLLERRSSSV